MMKNSFGLRIHRVKLDEDRYETNMFWLNQGINTDLVIRELEKAIKFLKQGQYSKWLRRQGFRDRQ